jgi:signal peptide peptidase SppA
MDIYKLFAGRPWAITLEAFEALLEIAPIRAASFGQEMPSDAPRTDGGVGVIPVRGTIAHHSDMWSWLFGETTVDSIEQSLRQFAADPAIKSIVLDIDSPGGSSSGQTEIAAVIRSLRSKKPIVAVANGMAASAAYNIGASAGAFYASPSSLVGSVGVYALHMDYSGAMENEGVKPSFISAGKYKVEGNQFEPLSDEARDHMQHIVDETYAAFVTNVAKGRGVSEATVKKDFGQGRVMTAREAKAAGMVDDIKTLDQAIKASVTLKARPAAVEGMAEELEAPEPAMDDEGTQRLGRMRLERMRAFAATSGGV